MMADIREVEILSYRDFYDHPQIFIGKSGKQSLLFDCRFNDESDDYEDYYRVYLMPDMNVETLQGSWVNLSEQAIELLGIALKKDMQFDPTLRAKVSVRISPSNNQPQ